MRLRDALLPPSQHPAPGWNQYEVREAGYIDMRQPGAMRQAREMLAPSDPADPSLPPGCSGDDDWCQVHGIRSPSEFHRNHTPINSKPDPLNLGYYQTDEERINAQLQVTADVANRVAAEAAVARVTATAENDPAAAAQVLRQLADMADAEAINRGDY